VPAAVVERAPTRPIESSVSAPPAAPALSVSQPPGTPAPPHCPEEMALVTRFQGAYCVDRYEASIDRVDAAQKTVPWSGNRSVDGIEAEILAVSVPGRKPQGYISGAQAAKACARAGKRLCEIDEWVRACKGPRVTRYPYGNQRQPKLCNDRFKVLDHHPVVSLWHKDAAPGADPRLMWYPSFMNDPRLHEFAYTVAATGSFPKCTNEYGVYDMVGNLHEWVADPDGTFLGGFFMDTFQNGEGCEYRTTGHEFEYHDYSTGFRCCADPRP
jgi:sulfatase-modifying factor enzyme 1